MKTTRVQRADLLVKVQANRDKHAEEYKEAKKIWRKKAIKAMKKALKQAEDGGQIEMYPLLNLPKPVQYLNSYDTLIARLEMETQDVVELDEQEFSAYVLDKWDWHGHFAAQTTVYNSSR